MEAVDDGGVKNETIFSPADTGGNCSPWVADRSHFDDRREEKSPFLWPNDTNLTLLTTV